jgi:hypothetical protein
MQTALDDEAAILDESYAEFRAMLKLIGTRNRRYSIMNRLETLIETFGTHSCGKVMDRIYGLLGMAHDVHPVSDSNPTADPTEDYLDSLDLTQENIPEPSRGIGVLKIDYSCSMYELWVAVIKFVFFRAKSRHLETKFGGNNPFRNQERRISIVRTAGVIQAALDQMVENDPLLVPKASVRNSAFPESMSSKLTEPKTHSKPQVRVIGFLGGELLHIGPEYNSFIGSFQARQDWLGSWEDHYTEEGDLERLHELNDRYTDKILRYSHRELARIRELCKPNISAWRPSAKIQRTYSKPKLDQPPQYTSSSASDAPRMFLGTGHLIGLAPPATQVGDVIVQFWNCDAAIVMRPGHTPPGEITGCSASFSAAGRADVVQMRDGKGSPGTDAWAEERICGSGSGNLSETGDSQAVYVDLDFETLQAITASIRT